MKTNYIYLVIALVMALLISYFCQQYAVNSFKTIYIIGTGMSSFLLLGFLLSIEFPDKRTTINIKALSSLFFLINTIVILFFAFGADAASAYLVITSFLLIIYLGIVYSIAKAKSQIKSVDKD